MAEISDVYVMNTEGEIDKRDTKHCVCILVSADKDKYVLINRFDIKKYDGFEIKKSDYAFLDQDIRYVGCSRVYDFGKDRILRKVGNLTYNDMKRILEKIRNSKFITAEEKDVIVPKLEKWLGDYAKNKLSHKVK